MSYPLVIFWAFVILGMVTRGPIMLYVFIGSWPFAAFAAIPPELTAGVTLTPAWLAAVFLFIKILLEEGSRDMARELLDPRRSGLLTLCALWGTASAFLFPRLFQGLVDVVPMRVIGFQRAAGVEPQSSNLTQTLYFLITVMTLGAASLACRHPAKFRQSRNALLFGAGVMVATGIADMIFGNGAALAPFRTATYTLLTDAEVMNARRIVGLTPEASSFASIAMIFLTPIIFLRPTYSSAFTRNFIIPLMVFLLIALICLSTSSTGYVGLIVLALTVGGHWAWLAARGRPEAFLGVGLFYFACVVLLLLISFDPKILEYPVDMFTLAVLKKSASASFAERNMWNETSLQAFVDTFGLGVGLGSARASSWPVSVLANVGIPGALLISGFLAHFGLARPRVQTEEARLSSIGIKFCIIAPLIMGALSATTVNMGLSNSWLFGMVGALSWASLAQKAPPPPPRMTRPVRPPPRRSRATAPSAPQADDQPAA